MPRRPVSSHDSLMFSCLQHWKSWAMPVLLRKVVGLEGMPIGTPTQARLIFDKEYIRCLGASKKRDKKQRMATKHTYKHSSVHPPHPPRLQVEKGIHYRNQKKKQPCRMHCPTFWYHRKTMKILQQIMILRYPLI